LILTYWQWCLVAVIVVLAVRAFPEAWEQHQQERLEKQRVVLEIGARADREHAQVMAGDQAGVYGMYPPAVRG
jgi:hypothetical protein